MITNSSVEILSRISSVFNHSDLTIFPMSFNCISPSITSPNRHSFSCVQIVMNIRPPGAQEAGRHKTCPYVCTCRVVSQKFKRKATPHRFSFNFFYNSEIGRRRLKPEEAPSPRFSRRGAGAALKKQVQAQERAGTRPALRLQIRNLE